MAAWPNPYLPLLLIAALLAFEDWLSTPSCSGGSPALHPASGDLRAMLIADLMLLGSDATHADRFFRYHLMSKLITKSIQTTNPDMIIVLGDISAKGSEQSESKWVAVLEQFEGILGQYSSLPIHIVLGDKDVGGCLSLDGKLVHRMANHLPGLDSSGCGSFEISNTSFLSLNAIALLCGDNTLRFSVEKVMEMESHCFQRKRLNGPQHYHLGSEKQQDSDAHSWRQNSMTSGSGPIILLHIPLHKSDKSDGGIIGVPIFPEGAVSDHPLVSLSSKESGDDGTRLYDQLHTLPANSTQYILQALKPRIIFSAHAHSFSDYTHADGTREVTVPAMTWKKSGVPGFVIATFGQKGAVSVKCCSLAQEWYIVTGYSAFLFLTALAVRWSHWM
ncbi:metallophosphoesterase 1-like [Lolium rigidum]|uniref:metallophosphoesterase 1-like n=1 Tax=Lolium rigidum TaxID=89674 RepID=UPI001F5CB7B5|nr:metallophosphoesterase 1-like [Lolium rigidum]